MTDRTAHSISSALSPQRRFAGLTVRVLPFQIVPGTVFEEHAELSLKADMEEVCSGLDKAVMEMRKGETALITIPAEFAFGCAGIGVRRQAAVAQLGHLWSGGIVAGFSAAQCG